MSRRPMLSSSSYIRAFHLGLQPAPAWSAILGFVLFSALCVLAGAGSILRLFFPVGAFVVGVFLYRRYPFLYLGFTWWLWFLTPWVRRLIDYRSGWVNPSTVLLAPYLATLVTLATFLRYLPKTYRQEGLPFVLSCTAVFYACIIGLVNSKFGVNSGVINIISTGFVSTPTGVLVSTLEWLTPILISFHLFVNWQYYPEYRQNMQRCFRWGVLVMAVYGVVQYLVAPEWDRFWIKNVIELGGTSFGLPQPLGIRVFSTMNSPGPFALTMMAGLLLLLTDQSNLRFFAMVFGYLAFLLTLVRSAWLGWFLGLLIFISSLKAHLQIRLIITIFILGMCAFPLTTVEPFSEVISARVQTLSNLQEDGSYQARSDTYDRALGTALFEPIGNGLGLPGVDSAVVDLFLAMGWVGAIPYLSGVALLLFKLSQCIERRFDTFVSAASAISLSSLSLVLLGNPLIEFPGVILWSFLGIALAAHKYYQYQRIKA